MKRFKVYASSSRRYIQGSDVLDYAVAELKSYQNEPSMKTYVHNKLIEISKDPERFESNLDKELLIPKICSNAANNISDITGIYPRVVDGYTFELPYLEKTNYLYEWVDKIDSRSPEYWIDYLTTNWVSYYKKTLKFYYKELEAGKTDPSTYADSVLNGRLHSVILPHSLIADDDLAEQFIENTVMPTYRRNR